MPPLSRLYHAGVATLETYCTSNRCEYKFTVHKVNRGIRNPAHQTQNINDKIKSSSHCKLLEHFAKPLNKANFFVFKTI